MFKKPGARKFHFLILAFLSGLFLGINFSFIAKASEPAHKYLDYFHRVYQIIRSEYVEAPQNKDIFYGAIKGMIKSLNDPFSRFLDVKSYSDLKEMTTGKFVGVGIVITIRDGEVVVISPIDDSPAMRAGIKESDIITKVNNKPIKNFKLSRIIKMIKGLPNSKVKLHVKREGFDEEQVVEIERAPIKIKSVVYSIIKEKNIGYIKIKNFGSNTADDVSKALKHFNKNKIEKLVLDLRYNPGGLLQAAVKVSDLFLDRGKTIVSTRGRRGKKAERLFKSQAPALFNKKLIVLVNKGSASASEILSGAIRDNRRGKLLGVKTFGKGSVQKTFNLDRDVGVAITIARYYTPSGELIHKKGIIPHYRVPVDKLTKDEKDSVKVLNKKKLLKNFVTKNMKYNDDIKNKFYELLEKNRLKLSKQTANFILKREIYRYKKQPVYDLEFDKQLLTAMDYLVKQKNE